MLYSIFETSATGDTVFTIQGLFIALGVAIVLGVFISLAYMYAQREKEVSQGFALTLVMLPAVITIIILLVGSNVARAFSLAGAFSIIRFRSAPGSPKDITYVLFTMAIGLSCGMGFVFYAAMMAVVLCLVVLFLERVQFGNKKLSRKVLKITIPEDLDYKNLFEDVFSIFTLSSQLNKVKTTNLGSLFELEYAVVVKDDCDEKEFIDQLRCRNGNLNISLILRPQVTE